MTCLHSQKGLHIETYQISMHKIKIKNVKFDAKYKIRLHIKFDALDLILNVLRNFLTTN